MRPATFGTGKFPKVRAHKQTRLYSIEHCDGYTCLGFDVCQRRIAKLRAELERVGQSCPLVTMKAPRTGSLRAYAHLEKLQELAFRYHQRTGYKFTCELTPELIGLEGKRVEVLHRWKDGVSRRERFRVGKSTGWIPVHLRLANRRSHGGGPVCLGTIEEVRIIYTD